MQGTSPVSGKTILLAWMMDEAAKRGHRSWLMVHRKELVDQAAETFRKIGARFSYIAAGYAANPHSPIQICTIQTLVRRLDKLLPPHMVVFDEAHHVLAGMWLKVVEHCRESYMVGLTATPARHDGRGLGDVFDALVQGPSIPFLMEQGHLAEYDIISPYKAEDLDLKGIGMRGGDYAKGRAEKWAERVIYGDCVALYRKFVAPHTCLVYCTTRRGAREVRDRYRAQGINAHYVGGDTQKGHRQFVMEAFRRGTIPVVTSVDLFGEGLDAPGLKAVQFMRPTMSLPLYMQQVGRVLRPDSGRAIVIDQCNNVFRHGLVEEDREWTLEKGVVTPRKATEEPQDRLARCELCFAVFKWASECPRCGHLVPVKRKPPKEVDAELSKLDKEALKQRRIRQRAREIGQARTMEDLVLLAQRKGYKPGWAAGVYSRRTGKPFGPCFGYEKKVRRQLGG